METGLAASHTASLWPVTTSNGTLDSSFGIGGQVTTGFGTYTDLTLGPVETINGGDERIPVSIPTDDQATGVAVQPDGRIVVVGSTLNEPFNGVDYGGVAHNFALARYNEDGTPIPASAAVARSPPGSAPTPT